MDRLGDQPIEEKNQAVMKFLARYIDNVINPNTNKTRQNGFILMLFPFNSTDGRCNYISSADRKEVITLLKEQLKRFEGMPEPPTGHA